jgi:Na+/melibiose symporter-like transporter
MEFNLDFGFGPLPIPDSETVEIIWIIILVVGFLMIVGLILVCVYQIKKEKLQNLSDNKVSLIT